MAGGKDFPIDMVPEVLVSELPLNTVILGPTSIIPASILPKPILSEPERIKLKRKHAETVREPYEIRRRTQVYLNERTVRSRKLELQRIFDCVDNTGFVGQSRKRQKRQGEEGENEGQGEDEEEEEIEPPKRNIGGWGKRLRLKNIIDNMHLKQSPRKMPPQRPGVKELVDFTSTLRVEEKELHRIVIRKETVPMSPCKGYKLPSKDARNIVFVSEREIFSRSVYDSDDRGKLEWEDDAAERKGSLVGVGGLREWEMEGTPVVDMKHSNQRGKAREAVGASVLVGCYL